MLLWTIWLSVTNSLSARFSLFSERDCPPIIVTRRCWYQHFLLAAARHWSAALTNGISRWPRALSTDKLKHACWRQTSDHTRRRAGATPKLTHRRALPPRLTKHDRTCCPGNTPTLSCMSRHDGQVNSAHVQFPTDRDTRPPWKLMSDIVDL